MDCKVQIANAIVLPIAYRLAVGPPRPPQLAFCCRSASLRASGWTCGFATSLWQMILFRQTLMILFVLGLGLLIVRKMRTASPIIDFRVLGERNFAVSCVIKILRLRRGVLRKHGAADDAPGALRLRRPCLRAVRRPVGGACRSGPADEALGGREGRAHWGGVARVIIEEKVPGTTFLTERRQGTRQAGGKLTLGNGRKPK